MPDLERVERLALGQGSFLFIFVENSLEMTNPVYQDIIELIATANPERIAGYKPSTAILARVQELVTKQSADNLNAEEENELKYFVWLENLIGLAKARAQQLLLAA